ncbi:MAG: hypothetical protein ABI488_10005 [Polyangiaceae bacterium]
MAHAQEVGSRFPAPVEGTDGLRALRAVPGVEAIFRSRDGRVFYVAAREHDTIDWDRLLEVERGLQETGNPEVTIAVRAHQGREPRAMFEGLEEL